MVGFGARVLGKTSTSACRMGHGQSACCCWEMRAGFRGSDGWWFMVGFRAGALCEESMRFGRTNQDCLRNLACIQSGMHAWIKQAGRRACKKGKYNSKQHNDEQLAGQITSYLSRLHRARSDHRNSQQPHVLQLRHLAPRAGYCP